MICFKKVLLMAGIYLCCHQSFGWNRFLQEQALPTCDKVSQRHLTADNISKINAHLAPRKITKNSLCLVNPYDCKNDEGKESCIMRIGVTIPSEDKSRPPRLYYFLVNKQTGEVTKDYPENTSPVVEETQPEKSDSNY